MIAQKIVAAHEPFEDESVARAENPVALLANARIMDDPPLHLQILIPRVLILGAPRKELRAKKRLVSIDALRAAIEPADIFRLSVDGLQEYFVATRSVVGNEVFVRNVTRGFVGNAGTLV